MNGPDSAPDDGRAGLRTCPSCGVTLPVWPVDRPQDRAASAADQTQSDRDQTASDTDQTSSDAEQTSADKDQASSDDDQRTSDEDQDSADHDVAAGSDRTTYERTTLAREKATGDRVATSRHREQAADDRLESASKRDIAATHRDLGAETRDSIARGRDERDDLTASREDILLRAADDRTRAAIDRERAADDRTQAAADRTVAARDRAEWLRVRSVSEGLLKQAATDQLTGARTRFFGLDEAARELERAQRTRAPLTLVFVDVDGLKQLNDSRGHLAGDALLRLVGSRLRANLRRYDVIVRYGGDEFLCVLSDLQTRDVELRFERIAVELAAVDAEHSIGAGFAEALPNDNLEDLIARADTDLLARRSGKRDG